jgi:hypothetical protein
MLGSSWPLLCEPLCKTSLQDLHQRNLDAPVGWNLIALCSLNLVVVVATTA